VAARKAISQVVFSRVVMAAPAMCKLSQYYNTITCYFSVWFSAHSSYNRTSLQEDNHIEGKDYSIIVHVVVLILSDGLYSTHQSRFSLLAFCKCTTTAILVVFV